MQWFKAICCAAAVTAMTVAVAPNARADEWNKRTFLTFSGPVQIPGATLPAGTYLFQLADPDNARHVVEVASKDGTHVYGMFITIPNDRIDTPDDSVVMFSETPAGAPQAIEAWWYPGDRFGEEFVYPKNQAMRIAKANHREVLATESDVNGSAPQAERMNALRGSNVGRVDENGNMKSASPATNTAESVNKANTPPAASTTTATTTTAKNSTAKNSKHAAATTTAKAAPSNTVDGRDANANSKQTVGTTGRAQVGTTASNQSHRNRLPQTASGLELIELLSGLSLAGGLSTRALRRRFAQVR